MIFDIDYKLICKKVSNLLSQADGGELFMEECTSESYCLENSVLSKANWSRRDGFGLRAFWGDVSAFVHSCVVTDEEIDSAVDIIRISQQKQNGSYVHSLTKNNQNLYENFDPTGSSFSLQDKVMLLRSVTSYLESRVPFAKNIKISLSSSIQNVEIVRSDGLIISDFRPMIKLDIMLTATKNGTRYESGRSGCGGRFLYSNVLESWKSVADEAVRQLENNLESIDSPSGLMTVVLGSGWPGVILHEAVGHGLESDFNRKKVSVFSEMLGKNIASPGVTVVDNGTIAGARGSIHMDDEGTATSCTTLISDGVLVGYMYDTMNANIMGKHSTGNGRRESYSCLPMPRMTNTYMLPSKYTKDEIISSVKHGIYAESFSGGQVDSTSGKFVFSASSAYIIENGKISYPIKGATFIGDGRNVLSGISMIGNDLQLDPGIGTCSKNGQSIPVCVGQPTIKIESITVGGTASSN